MREFLFRGKRTDNGEWVYGNYCKAEMLNHGGTEHFIIEYSCDGSQYHIDPETVGQHTGLPDKNNVKIFEGDLSYYDWAGKQVLMSVIFEDGEFRLRPVLKYDFKVWDIRIADQNKKLEIIGNIYDNQELLEGGDKE